MTAEVRMIRVDASNAQRYVELVKALADFEHLEPPSAEASSRLIRDASAENPPFRAFLACLGEEFVGFVTFFFTYSTFQAAPALFLEDIFVLDQHRGKGVGTQMFRFCVNEAKKAGCARMEWTALDWNVPAHRFYEVLGGKKMAWSLFRLSAESFDDALDR